LVLRGDTMKKINFLLILFKLLKLNISSKEKSSNIERPILNVNSNSDELKEMHTNQENPVLLSDALSENETLQASNTTTASQIPSITNNSEPATINQLSKENPLIIENIPDFNDDGIIDIRDVIIAVIQAIEKYDDFNDY
jgi:hypothetical protein